MKLVLNLFLAVSILLGISISEIRTEYVKAVSDKEQTLALHKKLNDITEKDDVLKVAYKGAVLTLMAKYATSTKEKKTYFKEGVTLLENAIEKKPNSIELRYLRLGIQENAPKITGYKKNKEEDKDFILTNYSTQTNVEVKNLIKGFVMQSTLFNEEEKGQFKK